MTDLPPSWASATIGELCEVNPRHFDRMITDDEELSLVPMALVEAETGRLDPRCRTTYRDVKKRSLTHFQDDDVIFSKITPCMENGKIALAANLIGGRAVGSTEYHVLRARGAVVPKYLMYYLLQPAIRNLAERNMTGAVGQRRVSRSFLQALPVPLPPIAEQRRIVACLEDHLSRLEAAASGATFAARRLRVLSRSLLHAAVAGHLASQTSELDAERELRELEAERTRLIGKAGAPAMPAEIAGYKPPSHWKVVSLDALCYDHGYGTSTKCNYDAAGTPVLRIPNIQDGEIDLRDLKNAVDPSLDLANLYVRAGDVLFVRTNGSRDLIGRVATVRESLEVAFASYLIRFRLVPDGVPADWIRIVVDSTLWRQYLEGKAASSAGQHNLNSKTLAQLPIPVPPRKELTEILSEVERQTSLMTATAGALRSTGIRSVALRKSLLAEAFAGRLAPQEPMDEPADRLLVRIRQESAASRPIPSTRGRAARKPRPEAAPAHSDPPAGASAEIQEGTLW